MERVAFLIEETGQHITCLLNPETVVMTRTAGVEPRRSSGGRLTGSGLADDPLMFTGGGRTELKLDIQHTREEISATLDALEGKLNLRRRARDGIADLRRRIRRTADEDPLLLVAVGVGAVVVVGGVVWAVARAARR